MRPPGLFPCGDPYFNREKAAGEAAFGGRRRWAA
jgi:hypothetical protein